MNQKTEKTASEEMSAQMEPATLKKFYHWQWRTIGGSMFGYALYYFVRKNFSVANGLKMDVTGSDGIVHSVSAMQHDLGITNVEIGIILTLFNIVYGLGKFGNGILADRINGRKFMLIGLVGAALVNLVMGFTSSVAMLAILFAGNAWFQSMGFPACCRLLTHWVHPKELATKMSIWNTSHSMGSISVMLVCGVLLAGVFNMGWKMIFYIPAFVSLTGAIIVFFLLRDTPSSVGLPEMKVAGQKEVSKDDKSPEAKAEYRYYLKKYVFGNPYIWILCAANFFVYTVRFGVLDWGPKLFNTTGSSITKSTLMVVVFESCGALGMIAGGWATDKWFKGKASRTCVFCMAGCAIFLSLFILTWFSEAIDPGMKVWIALPLLALAGFFLYGPQALVGIASANLATKRAAASAAGLTGTFAYASGFLSGMGVGLILDFFKDATKSVSFAGIHMEMSGEKMVLFALIGFAIVAMLVFMLAWKAPSHARTEEQIAEEIL